LKSVKNRTIPESRATAGNQSGFSLVELIFVIVLIGIISMVAVAKYADLSSKSKAAVCMTNQYALESAQSIFFADQLTKDNVNPHYAANLDELAPYMAHNRIPTCPLGFSYEIQPQGKIRCQSPEHERHF
jgi:prepilin-type N-terminal cleavage/methylation domain-containing protein